MYKLNTISEIKENLSCLDPQNMWGIIASFPNQMEKASRVSLPDVSGIDADQLYSIVFCGMGGSAIGGDLLATYLAADLQIPMMVNRNYTLPGFVNDRTLVVVSSYSGNTEETLSAYQMAEERGAQILGISSNGVVKEQLSSAGWPLITIPGGIQPRAALGYSFIPMARMFHRLGLTKRSVDDDIDETIKFITNLSREYSENENNKAFDLAAAIIDTVPIIYTPPELAVVGTRWKGQLAENAQMFSFTNVIPEMNHNEIVGWDGQPEFINNTTLIWLTDKGRHPRVQKRIDIAGELLEDIVPRMYQFSSAGECWMTRLFSLIYLGDWVSLYAALIQQVDPTAIDRIEMLKKRLND